MPATDAGQGVVVSIGPCRCPGTDRPHPDGDTVTLAPVITIPMGIALNQAMNDAVTEPGAMKPSAATIAGALSRVYLEFGIIGWNFVDEAGKPVPISPEATQRLIPWGNGGTEVAEEADRLYGADFLAPLVRRQSEFLKRGQMATSTSATNGSGAPRRKHSGSSSRHATAGKR